MLRSGARWRDLPPKYGSRSTSHRRLQEWQDQGVWEQIRLKLLSTLDSQAKLDWSRAFLDGSFVPGKKGGGYAYGWKGKGSTVHLVTEGNGLPLAFLVTAANVSEVTVGLEVVDRVKKGEKAIRSITYVKATDPTGDDEDEETDTVTYPKTVYLFYRTQVEKR